MKAAANDSGLVIFPGVEISMSEGFHLVTLFDPTVDQKHLESFLGLVNIRPRKMENLRQYVRKAFTPSLKKFTNAMD